MEIEISDEELLASVSVPERSEYGTLLSRHLGIGISDGSDGGDADGSDGSDSSEIRA